MTFVPYPDAPMADSEVRAAELAMLCGEITHSDFAWLMGLEDEQSDRAPPRGFKSWRHFEAFKWHQQQRRLGRPSTKRRKKAA